MSFSYFDAPETPSKKSKWLQWGYHYFKDGLTGAPVDFLEPNKNGPSTIRLTGRPITDASGQVVGILPFIQPRPSRPLDASTDKLFAPTSCYRVRVGRYIGPPPEYDQQTKQRLGLPQLHFIDEWPPDVRRQYLDDGRQLPPTCLDILLARAPSVVMSDRRFMTYYDPNRDDFYNSLRRPQSVFFLQGYAYEHGKVDCSVEAPLPCIHLLTWTAYSSMMSLILQENEDYVYPPDVTHELAGSPEELAKRFLTPNLTSPEAVPAVRFIYHRQKQRSQKAGGSGKMGNTRYEAELTRYLYPCDIETQKAAWIEPDDLFWYPTPKETFELLLNNSGEPGWTEFLVTLAQGTDLEVPQTVQGADLTSAQVAPPAPPVAPAPQASAPQAHFDAGEDYDGEDTTPQPPPSPQDAPRVVQPGRPKTPQAGAAQAATPPDALNSEVYQGQRAAAQQADIPPAPVQMPVPDTQAFERPAQTTPADLPENVADNTQAAIERLRKLREGTA